LAANAGVNGAVIIQEVRRQQKEQNNSKIGYNVLSNEYTDMIAAGVPDPAKVTHTVVKGDTLSSIAKKTLGKANLWEKIAKANGLSGTTIVPGQVLTIPQV